LNLKAAADYVRTSRGPAALMSFLRSIRSIFDFREERANRLSRYVLITRKYLKGDPVADIETEYGCSRSTVLRYARLAGAPTRPKHFPAEIRKAVIADYQLKIGDDPVFSVEQIAAMHDVSPAYVSKIAREAGISRYAPRPKAKSRS
jgi:hypothetical protein